MPTGSEEVNADASSRTAFSISLFIGGLRRWLLPFDPHDKHGHEGGEAIDILFREIGREYQTGHYAGPRGERILRLSYADAVCRRCCPTAVVVDGGFGERLLRCEAAA